MYGSPRAMPVLVAIDVPPVTPPDLVAVVTGTCSAALGDGACVVADLDASPRYFAVVRWGGEDGVSLRVELRDASRVGTTLDTRLISFAPVDRARQRWASAGLVVAALVAQREAGVEPAPLPRVEPLPVAEPPAVAAPPEFASTPPLETVPVAWWAVLDTAAVGGPALGGETLRLGSALRLSVAPRRDPVGLYLGGRTQVRPGIPTATWIGGDLGIVARWGAWNAAYGAELRAGATLECLSLGASEPLTGERDRRVAWRAGGRLGLEAGVLLRDPLVLFAGAEASLLRPEVQIEVAGEPAGSDPPVGVGVWAGLRILLPGRPRFQLPAAPEPVRL